ncbi:MAG: hypothetical protein LC632_03750 [Xanthomonadaceae bacterium]|nr:hypothetical protein [Xanthomonadaceae bacterium]
MRGFTRSVLLVLAVSVAACAPVPAQRTDLIRHYECDDGSTFSLEVQGPVVRLYTVTGVIELPRQRGAEPALYSNGLRSIVVTPEGTVRHAMGRRAWTECRTIN